MKNLLVRAANTGSSALNVATARGSNVAGELEIGEERGVEGVGNTRAAELELVRTVEAHAVLLGLGVVGVHVEVQVGRVTSVVGVDIPEEWTAAGSLIGQRLQNHASMDSIIITVHALHFVVDEALAGVELAAGLAIHNEDIRSLNRAAAATGGGGSAVGVFERKLARVQAGNETGFSDRGLLREVSTHVQRAFTGLDDNVMGQAAGRAANLGIGAYGLLEWNCMSNGVRYSLLTISEVTVADPRPDEM